MPPISNGDKDCRLPPPFAENAPLNVDDTAPTMRLSIQVGAHGATRFHDADAEQRPLGQQPALALLQWDFVGFPVCLRHDVPYSKASRSLRSSAMVAGNDNLP